METRLNAGFLVDVGLYYVRWLDTEELKSIQLLTHLFLKLQ